MCVAIDIIIPNAIKNDNKDEPPLLINGSGIPTTGIIPTTIDKFINTVDKNNKLKPPIVSLQNLSLAFKAKYKHLSKMKKKMTKSIQTPINPNSSAMTEKIKSVSVSG